MIETEQITPEEMIHFLKQTKETSIELANQMGISEKEQSGFQRDIKIIDAVILTIKESQYLLK